MSFWEKIEKRLRRLSGNVADDELRAMVSESVLLEQAVKSPAWEVIWEKVLLPLREDANKKLLVADPAEFSDIAQLQKIVTVIDQIPVVIEKKIQAGLNAQKILNETPPPKEGESNE